MACNGKCTCYLLLKFAYSELTAVHQHNLYAIAMLAMIWSVFLCLSFLSFSYDFSFDKIAVDLPFLCMQSWIERHSNILRVSFSSYVLCFIYCSVEVYQFDAYRISKCYNMIVPTIICIYLWNLSVLMVYQYILMNSKTIKLDRIPKDICIHFLGVPYILYK